MHRSSILLAAATAVLLLGAGCKKSPPAPTAPNPPGIAAPTEAPAATPLPFVAPAPTTPPPPDIPSVPMSPPTAADAIAPEPPPNAPRVIRIAARRWEFIPSEIRVRKGERIALDVTSMDVPHGIAIPTFGINRSLAPGITERIEFTADNTGTFTAPCSVYCGNGHRGMRMTIIVE